MKKKELNMFDKIALAIFILLVIASLIFEYMSPPVIHKAPSTPPTFHEFYGIAQCNDGRDVVDGKTVTASTNSNEYNNTKR